MTLDDGRRQPQQTHVTFQPKPRPKFVAFRAKKTNHAAWGAGGCLTFGFLWVVWLFVYGARLTWNLFLFTGWALVVACQWLWWVAFGRRRAQRVHTYTYHHPPGEPPRQ